MLRGFQHSYMMRDLLQANTWIGCDGVFATLGNQGTAVNPAPQGKQLGNMSASEGRSH